MAGDLMRTELHDLAGLVGSVARDTRRLVRQHVDLLRSEIRQGTREAPTALAMIGAGGGLVAVGGVMGTMMVVHGLHKSTRIPLWGCYGLVGGALAIIGGELIAAGSRRAAAISLVPRETIAAFNEDLEWLSDQIDFPTS
jgi:hypothetical protein